MFIRSIKHSMVLSGTWDINWTKEPLLKIFQLWYRLINHGILLIFSLLTFAKLVQLISIRADAEIICECASVFFTMFVIVIKMSIYQYNNTSRLFQDIINEEKKIITSLDDQLIQSYNSNMKVYIKLKNGFQILTSVAGVGAVILNSINYMRIETDQKSEKDLLQESFFFQIWLPYKERDHLVSVVIINVVFAFVGLNMFMTDQIVPYALMAFATVELKMLQERIRNLETKTETTNVEYYRALRKIAMDHFFVISFVNKLNHYVRYATLTTFLLNSVNVASTVMEVLMQNTLRDMAYPVFFLLNLIANVFLLGWFANEIKVQSLAIGDTLYQTKWYNRDQRVQKLLLIMLGQSQQPLTFSIGPFGAMTLETALKTMQAAYSYITLMRNIK